MHPRRPSQRGPSDARTVGCTDTGGSAGSVHHGPPDVMYVADVITAAFPRTLHGAPLDSDVDQSPPDRLTKQLREMLLMPADESYRPHRCPYSSRSPYAE